MRLLFSIALRHLMFRKRQSIVSLLGIVIGVGFFLCISSLMQGSQNDFIRRIIDTAPHITVSDEYRTPKKQPVEMAYPKAAIVLHSLKPQTETRGIRGYRRLLEKLQSMPGVRASGVLTGQALLSFAGKDINISLNGMVPEEIIDITTIAEDMVEGSIDNLITNRNGIIIGAELARQMMLGMGENITLAAATGEVRTFKIVGIFRTGRAEYDTGQAFVDLKRVQALMNRANRANSIIIKLDDPDGARSLAAEIERQVGYKALSWQESSEDIMNTLAIRNMIMYSVVSAVLIVAAFGIYNIISTVVLEKSRDIAILKSIGFTASDIRSIFLVQGIILGLAGIAAGIPLGCAMMYGLMQIEFKPPGVTEPFNMPIDWSWPQFMIASAFAFFSSLLAAFLPARKGARVMPVDILRGGQ